MLISQLWTNTAPYCSWMFDMDSEPIELTTSEDTESEEEEKKEKKIDEIPIYSLSTKIKYSIISLSFLKLEDFNSLPHPEILTPPPQFFT